MKLNLKNAVGALALLAMALPLWAHTDSVQFDATQSTTIEGVKLAPGNYELKADDSTNKVTVRLNGSYVTEIPCHWIKLPEKAGQDEVLSNNNQVTELEFSGKTEAVTFNR